ncbi:MAG: SBBP repeat-containing protein [Deltaproteobacteria bacterium]|nr:SBBP repeat-containing protein [Deltaproteobacteria bacterium]
MALFVLTALTLSCNSADQFPALHPLVPDSSVQRLTAPDDGDASAALSDYAMQFHWERRYTGAGSNTDKAVRVLGSGGNVFAVGSSYASGARRDVVVVKYNSAGNEQWVARLDGQDHLDDVPTDAVMTADGDVIVVGWTQTAFFGHDWLIARVDGPTGNVEWTQFLNGADSLDDEAVGVTFDSSGNIVVAGTLRSSINGMQMGTHTFSPAGGPIWLRVFGGPGDEVPTDIARGGDRIVVTGWIEDGADRDVQTVAYSDLGLPEWDARYDGDSGFDSAAAVQVDSDGVAYVVGQVESAAGDAEGAALRYLADGSFDWERMFPAPAGEAIFADAVWDGSALLCAGHEQTAADEFRHRLVRLEPDGDTAWSATAGSFDTMGDAPTTLAALGADWMVVGITQTTHFSSLGGVLAALSGALHGSDDGLGRAALAPFDCCDIEVEVDTVAGATAWSATYAGQGDPSVVVDEPFALIATSDGGVVVTGRCWSSDAGDDMCTVKYDTDGNVAWEHRYDGGAGAQFDEGRDIAQGDAGDIAVAGPSVNPVSGDPADTDFAVARLDANGAEQWRSRYDGDAGGADNARRVVIDKQGNVIVVGESDGVTGGVNVALAKWNAAGVFQWDAIYDGPAGGPDRPRGLAFDGAGNIFVTGYSQGVGTGRDLVLLKYSPSGDEIFAVRVDGSAHASDEGYQVVTDADGNAYVTGYVWETSGFLDYFTAAYDADGDELWSATYDGDAAFRDAAVDLAVDTAGNVFVAGTSFGSGGSDNIVTVAYDESGDEMWTASYDGPGGPPRDVAVAIDLDIEGGVYVGGTSNFFATDFVIVKYGPDGDYEWEKRYDGGTGRENILRGVAVNSAGDVFGTGSADIAQTFYDYLTVKFKPCIGCLINGTCWADGTSPGGDPCRKCVVSQSTTSWTNQNGVSCDDGAWCNGEDTCSGGSCSAHTGTPCASDGVFCNGVEQCDEGADTCFSPGDPCPSDGQFCNGTESCDEGSDACVRIDRPCVEDGLWCNGETTCDESGDECVTSDAPCADDGVFCNGDEVCNDETDGCESTGNPCPSDDVFCNGLEYCDETAGECRVTDPPCPDDGLFCNGEESCDEESGMCVSSGKSCPDDGVFCNGVEQCNEESDECESLGDPCVDDGFFCNGEESCDEGGSACVSSGNPCDEGTLCDDAKDSCVAPDDDADDDDNEDDDDVSDDDGGDDDGAADDDASANDGGGGDDPSTGSGPGDDSGGSCCGC